MLSLSLLLWLMYLTINVENNVNCFENYFLSIPAIIALLCCYFPLGGYIFAEYSLYYCILDVYTVYWNSILSSYYRKYVLVNLIRRQYANIGITFIVL